MRRVLFIVAAIGSLLSCTTEQQVVDKLVGSWKQESADFYECFNYNEDGTVQVTEYSLNAGSEQKVHGDGLWFAGRGMRWRQSISIKITADGNHIPEQERRYSKDFFLILSASEDVIVYRPEVGDPNLTKTMSRVAACEPFG